MDADRLLADEQDVPDLAAGGQSQLRGPDPGVAPNWASSAGRVCWAAFGSPDGIRLRLGEAVADAYDAFNHGIGKVG